MTAWDVIDLEPECTLFSTVNSQNTTSGCAHGKHAEKPASIANMAPERLVEERRMYAEARAGVVTGQGCNLFALWGKMTPTTNLEPAIFAVGCELELVLKWGFRGNNKNS